MSMGPISREIIERAEWVAIATAGPEGPHLTATWGDYVRAMGLQDDQLLIPAGTYRQTEKNLEADSRVQLLFATRQVQGEYGRGRGCCISGRAELQTSGPEAERVKAQFPWARGALVIHVEDVQIQL